MKCPLRLVFLGLFGLVLSATTANATPVVCSAMLASGGGPAKLYQASVDPAVSCSGPVIDNNVFPSNLAAFGFTWLAQDKDPDEAALNGANESVLSINGVNATGGSFTINPANSQCGLVDCNFFVFGLKFGPAVAYWNLGNITTTTTFNWETNKNALSNGAIYGRAETFLISAPEPGMMLLLGTGAVFGIRRRLTASK